MYLVNRSLFQPLPKTLPKRKYYSINQVFWICFNPVTIFGLGFKYKYLKCDNVFLHTSKSLINSKMNFPSRGIQSRFHRSILPHGLRSL